MTAESSDAHGAIRAVLSRYDRAENLGRHPELTATFEVGGVLDDGGRLLRGRPAIQAEFDRRRNRPRVAGSPAGAGSVLRQITSTQIEFVSSTEARCYSRFVATSQFGVDHHGHYADLVRFVDGAWLIAHRRVTVDATAATSAQRLRVRRNRGSGSPHVIRPAVAGPSVGGRSRMRFAR